MVSSDTPEWVDFQPNLFRLPGFGGAAVFLRTGVVLPDGKAPALSVDVGLLSTVDHVQYLSRPATRGFSQQLSELFLAAAADPLPEITVPDFTDPLSGLECRVESSTDTQVSLLVQIPEDLSAEQRTYAGVDFLTSRAALAQAAIGVRVLENTDDDPVIEPSSDWS